MYLYFYIECFNALLSAKWRKKITYSLLIENGFLDIREIADGVFIPFYAL